MKNESGLKIGLKITLITSLFAIAGVLLNFFEAWIHIGSQPKIHVKMVRNDFLLPPQIRETIEYNLNTGSLDRHSLESDLIKKFGTDPITLGYTKYSKILQKNQREAWDKFYISAFSNYYSLTIENAGNGDAKGAKILLPISGHATAPLELKGKSNEKYIAEMPSTAFDRKLDIGDIPRKSTIFIGIWSDIDMTKFPKKMTVSYEGGASEVKLTSGAPSPEESLFLKLLTIFSFIFTGLIIGSILVVMVHPDLKDIGITVIRKSG